MADVKTQRGGEMLDNFFTKKGHNQTRESYDEDLALKQKHAQPPAPRRESLAHGGGFVPALADAVSTIAERANAAFEAGLTEEAIVILATAAAPWPKGAKHKLSEEQIKAALQGFRDMKKFLVGGR